MFLYVISIRILRSMYFMYFYCTCYLNESSALCISTC
jgi:hypothetical protein